MPGQRSATKSPNPISGHKNAARAHAKHVVGIDFGTSTTVIAVRTDDGLPEVLPIGLGGARTWMPSVVSADGRTVGEQAEGLDNRLRSVKSDLTDTEADGGGTAPGPNGLTYDEAASHVEHIIREAVTRAQARNPRVFDDAKVFVGCPALWSARNRKKIVEICRRLGLDVSVDDVLDEPVAAGVEWINTQWQINDRVHGDVVVVDAGGGTLDVAYLRVAELNPGNIQPRPVISLLFAASVRNSGDAIDKAIAVELVGSPDSLAADAQRAWLDAARQLKEALSVETEASINVAPPVSRVASLGRASIADLAGPFLSSMKQTVRRASRGSLLRGDESRKSISPTEIRQRPWSEVAARVHHVVLVGGVAHMPAFHDSVTELFPDAKVHRGHVPQEMVARGLCYGETIIELNLPRPPIDFYARFGTGEPVHIYEAFTPLYDPADAVCGMSHLGHKWSAAHDGPVSIHAETPSKPGKKITFAFTDGTGKEQTEFTVMSDTRCARGSAVFKLYATGELVISGANVCHYLRVRDWAQTPAGEEKGATIRIAREDSLKNPQPPGKEYEPPPR